MTRKAHTKTIKSIAIALSSLLILSCGGDDGTSNILPTANAGANQTIDEYEITMLNGTGSDTDGSVASYSWTQLSGTPVIIEGSDTATATFNTPEVSTEETLILTLTVTDNDGSTATDSVEIKVIPNTAPTLTTMDDFEVDEQTSVDLNSTAEDEDGSIVSYTWVQTSGTPVTIEDPATPTATFIAPNVSTQETLLFTLTVTDNDGDSATDAVEITIIANTAPTLTAGEDFGIDEQTTATLSGSAEDIDGSIISYTWTQTFGTPVTIEDSNAPIATFNSPNIETEETLEFQLSVVDDDGDISTDTISVAVSPLFFSITLSDNINRCGNTVSESVDISFFNAEGEQSSYTINHPGIEQTYSFPQESSARKTIKILKKGRDAVIVDAAPSSELYFKMEHDDPESCGCPEYNIILADDNFNSMLWVGGKITNFPQINNNEANWSAIEVCDNQTDSVYIVNGETLQAAQVPIGEQNTITVANLSDMNTTILDGGIPLSESNITGYTIRPRGQLTAYSNQNLPGNSSLKNILGYSRTLEGDDDTLSYPVFDSLTDLDFSIQLPVEYINFSISDYPSFASGNSDIVLIEEYHQINTTKENISSGFSYDLLDFESINISMTSDELLVTADKELPFDAVFFIFYTSGDEGPMDIYAPIINNAVDFGKISNVVSGFTGAMVLLLTDELGVDSYDAAVERYFTKRISGQTSQRRSILLYSR